MLAIQTRLRLTVAAVLIVLLVPGVVQSAEASDGSGIQWKVSDLFYGRPAVAPDGSVYVLMSKLNGDGTKSPVGLRALDTDGNKRWQIPVSGECSELVVDGNGTIYYTEYSRNSYDSELVALGSDGVPLWRVNSSETFPAKRFASFGGPVISADGDVLVTFDDRLEPGYGESRLCSFSSITGSMNWNFVMENDQPRIYVGGVPGSNIYAVSSYGRIHCLYPNGTLAWTRDLSEQGLLIQLPAMTRKDGGVYVTVHFKDYYNGWRNFQSLREVWALSSNGSTLWTYVPLAGIDAASGCDVAISGESDGGAIYLGQQAGVELDWNGNDGYDPVPGGQIPASVMAVDQDGQPLWKVALPANVSLSFPLIATDTSLYAFTLDEEERGGIVGFATSNGSLLGSYVSPAELWVSGLTRGGGDRFYFFEGIFKGADQGTISLICASGVPPTALPRPLDLVAASLAWSSVIGLAAVSGFFAIRKKGP